MSLKDVIGQEKALRLLHNTLKTGRIPSALLFAGEPGIGKRYTAINFAKALNCLNQEHDSCDACPSCKKIDSGIHPDLLFLRPEKGEIRIDEIRAIEEALSFRPFEGKRKVVIIDDAEKMNHSACNAFLKTLEEPPSGSVIILVTSSPDSLPSTIRSRCCRINFSPISEKGVEEVIRRLHLEGDKVFSPLVRLLMGRPGLISSDFFGNREGYLSMLKGMLKGSSNPWKDREEMEEFIEFILLIVRDMAVYKIGQETGILNTDMSGFLKEIARRSNIKDIIDTYEEILLLRRYLEYNLNLGITWNYVSSMLRNISKGGS